MTTKQFNKILKFIGEDLDYNTILPKDKPTLSITDKFGNKYEAFARDFCGVNEGITYKDDILQIPIASSSNEVMPWVYIPVEYIVLISTTLRD